VTVANSATLGGRGVVRGAVTIQSGGTLAPGTGSDSIGTLTVNNSVTLQAGSFTRMRIGKSPSANSDLLRLSGTSSVLTCGGTLVLTNLSGTVTVGDSFTLFSATSYAGAFSSIIPATPGVGLVWNTNNLASNGTLSVALGTIHPQLNFTERDGGSMILSGSGGAAGYAYTVLTSTNLTAPVASWGVVGTGTFDASGNFSFTNSVDPQLPKAYFAIQVP
jgi:hypothetical protein